MAALTFKQGSFLYRMTGRKFWEVSNPPPPTCTQASHLIGLCIQFMKAQPPDREDLRTRAVDCIQTYFPDFDPKDFHYRAYHNKGKKNRKNEPAEQPNPNPNEELPIPFGNEKKSEPLEQPAPKDEPEPAELEQPPNPEEVPPPAYKEAAEEAANGTQAEILRRVAAGLRNLFLIGPAGTGKTTLCHLTGMALDLPVTVLSCNLGTSPSEVKGYQFPEPRACILQGAIAAPGIVVLDEITMLDPAVAAVLNALLANGEIQTTTGLVKRHPDNTIIATANTAGQGADRVYIGNNQLDAATLDRFAGGFINVDYDRDYEGKHFDSEVCAYVWNLRDQIKERNLRRVMSTRSIIAADKLKKAGHTDWNNVITEQWTDDERRACEV